MSRGSSSFTLSHGTASIYFDLFGFFPYFRRLVKELGNQDIVQIACGDQHAMALSRGSFFQAHFSSKRESHYGRLALGRERLNSFQ